MFRTEYPKARMAIARWLLECPDALAIREVVVEEDEPGEFTPHLVVRLVDRRAGYQIQSSVAWHPRDENEDQGEVDRRVALKLASLFRGLQQHYQIRDRISAEVPQADYPGRQFGF